MSTVNQKYKIIQFDTRVNTDPIANPKNVTVVSEMLLKNGGNNYTTLKAIYDPAQDQWTFQACQGDNLRNTSVQYGNGAIEALVNVTPDQPNIWQTFTRKGENLEGIESVTEPDGSTLLLRRFDHYRTIEGFTEEQGNGHYRLPKTIDEKGKQLLGEFREQFKMMTDLVKIHARAYEVPGRRLFQEGTPSPADSLPAVAIGMARAS